MSKPSLPVTYIDLKLKMIEQIKAHCYHYSQDFPDIGYNMYY